MFAHNNRVRHLFSGGRHFFRDNDQSQKYSEAFKSSIDHDVDGSFSVHAGAAGEWRRVSSTAILMADKNSPIASYIGVTDKEVGKHDTGCLGKVLTTVQVLVFSINASHVHTITQRWQNSSLHYFQPQPRLAGEASP